MLQNATPLRKSVPDLLTALMNMSLVQLVLRLPRKMHLCRSSSNVPRLPSFLEMLQNPHVLLTFDKVHNPLRLPRVHFFDISTSKSGPNMVCFVHFDFEMCFAPQRRALFSTAQLPKVLRTRSVFSFFSCKCASRHKGVQFFISHLASWLRTRRFSEPPFRPSGATNHRNNTVFRDFPTLSCTWVFFLLLFSSLTLPISAFHLSILSEIWLLNFLRSFIQNLHLLLSYTPTIFP